MPHVMGSWYVQTYRIVGRCGSSHASTMIPITCGMYIQPFLINGHRSLGNGDVFPAAALRDLDHVPHVLRAEDQHLVPTGPEWLLGATARRPWRSA